MVWVTDGASGHRCLPQAPCYGHHNLGPYADDTSTIDYVIRRRCLCRQTQNRRIDGATDWLQILPLGRISTRDYVATDTHLRRVIRGRHICITELGDSEQRLSARTSSWSNRWLQLSTCGTLIQKTVWHNPPSFTPATRPQTSTASALVWWYYAHRFWFGPASWPETSALRTAYYAISVRSMVQISTMQAVYRVTIRPSEENRPFSMYSPQKRASANMYIKKQGILKFFSHKDFLCVKIQTIKNK
jgi:hypothetical protein